MQVDRQRRRVGERLHVAESGGGQQLVHGASEHGQLAVAVRSGQHHPGVGVVPAQPAQGGHRGQQVAESQGAQHHDALPRPGPGGAGR
ncbi:hypothetical protein O984_03655 [Mycobacterium avium 05-4293]|nr:hypothetical protein O984_03655 [Mycobacterium avium 05-4293]